MQGFVPVTQPKQEPDMNTKFVRESRELATDELNDVSGGHHRFIRGKGLEGQDRMGNFAIQNLMSAFNQAETLASNVQKKLDDTISGTQQKIG